MQKVNIKYFFFLKKNSYLFNLFLLIGNKIFYPLKRSSQEIKDPFRPVELSEKAKSNAPSRLFAESRIPRRINLPNQSQSSDTFSEQQRKTKRIRNIKRGQDLTGKRHN